MQAVHGSLERRSPDCFNIVVLMKVVINRTHPHSLFFTFGGSYQSHLICVCQPPHYLCAAIPFRTQESEKEDAAAPGISISMG